MTQDLTSKRGKGNLLCFYGNIEEVIPIYDGRKEGQKKDRGASVRRREAKKIRSELTIKPSYKGG